jgi:DNA-binding NtrC family response regulator
MESMHNRPAESSQMPPAARALPEQSLGKVREQAEREHILAVLQQTDGNRARAARILGVSRKTLWKKLKHLGLSWPPELPPRDSG